MVVDASQQKEQPTAAFTHVTSAQLFAAQLAYRRQLRRKGRHLRFNLGNFELAARVSACLFRLCQCVARFGYVEVMAADRRVGQHGDNVRLHFENAARYEHLLFFGFARHLDTNHTRADAP